MMKENTTANPTPLFSIGETAYLIENGDKMKNTYFFTPHIISGFEVFPRNPKSPAPKRIVYTLEGKEFGIVFGESKLFTKDEATEAVNKEPKKYRFKR